MRRRRWCRFGVACDRPLRHVLMRLTSEMDKYLKLFVNFFQSGWRKLAQLLLDVGAEARNSDNKNYQQKEDRHGWIRSFSRDGYVAQGN